MVATNAGTVTATGTAIDTARATVGTATMIGTEAEIDIGIATMTETTTARGFC